MEETNNSAEPMRGEIPFAEEEVEDRPGREVVDGSRTSGRPQTRQIKILEEKHDEILRMIRAGETMRVIHTKIGVSRHAIDHYVKGSEDLKEAWEDAQEDLLDLHEEIVNEIATIDCRMDETENGNFPKYDGRTLATKFNAAKFRLERLGSKRGWNAKIETNEVGNGGRLPVIVMGELTEDDIAENEKLVEEANAMAVIGLEGISKG